MPTAPCCMVFYSFIENVEIVMPDVYGTMLYGILLIH